MPQRTPLGFVAFACARLLAGCLLLGWAASARASSHAGPQRLEVRGLADWDRLKMRLGPGPTSPAVGEIPPRASGVLGTGRQRQVGRAVWHEVEYQGVRGWVHGRYIRREPGASSGPSRANLGDVFSEDLVCVGNVPAWKLVVDRDGSTAASPAFGPALTDVHARAALPQKAPTQKAAARTWSMTLQDAQGVGVATLTLRESRCTAGNAAEAYAYEVTTHQPSGAVLTGCCNRRGGAGVARRVSSTARRPNR